jgi:CRISPR-associated endonuclease Csn1
LLAHLSSDPELKLSNIQGFNKTKIGDVRPIRVSRAPIRRGTGAAHQDTIRSVLAGNRSAIKTPLTELKLKDLENIVGFGRDHALINAIQSRLEEFDDNGKKAFDAKQQPPFRKPSKNPERAPIIRSVKLLRVQKSGIPVRYGIADNDKMIRADIFTKNNNFYAVPIYVADMVNKELPNKAVTPGVLEEDWIIMDSSYAFLFSLYPNDWVKLRLRKEIREGYYSSLDRSTGAINLWSHDRNPSIGKDGLLRGNGIKNALAIEKYHVDLLGNLYRVHKEERKSICIKNQRK